MIGLFHRLDILYFYKRKDMIFYSLPIVFHSKKERQKDIGKTTN